MCRVCKTACDIKRSTWPGFEACLPQSIHSSLTFILYEEWWEIVDAALMHHEELDLFSSRAVDLHLTHVGDAQVVFHARHVSLTDAQVPRTKRVRTISIYDGKTVTLGNEEMFKMLRDVPKHSMFHHRVNVCRFAGH